MLILRREIGYQVKRLSVTDNQVMVVPGAGFDKAAMKHVDLTVWHDRGQSNSVFMKVGRAVRVKGIDLQDVQNNLILSMVINAVENV